MTYNGEDMIGMTVEEQWKQDNEMNEATIASLQEQVESLKALLEAEKLIIILADEEIESLKKRICACDIDDNGKEITGACGKHILWAETRIEEK